MYKTFQKSNISTDKNKQLYRCQTEYKVSHLLGWLLIIYSTQILLFGLDLLSLKCTGGCFSLPKKVWVGMVSHVICEGVAH